MSKIIIPVLPISKIDSSIFIYLPFNKYVLSNDYVPGTVID